MSPARLDTVHLILDNASTLAVNLESATRRVQLNPMNASVYSRLSGEAWQAWADQLLVLKYGIAEYQRIPAKDSGDAGIEGFAICGHAYQAYGVQEPLSTRERYEKQRDKMTDDVAKFIKNQAKLRDILGDVKISRWCFFVPMFDSKELVIHASAKTEEVKAKQLPYVATEFRVMVVPEDDFIAERDRLLEAKGPELNLLSEGASREAVDEWEESHNELAEVIDEKLSHVPKFREKSKRIRFRRALVKHLLEGQNALQRMRDYPNQYEKIKTIKSNQERFLEAECLAMPHPANEVLQRVMDIFLAEISAKIPGLSKDMYKAFAWEAIADWLIRCPLDFAE